ncbi:helicase associated domain-containing protein [Streptomyces fagopyri]|uniref:helicase associated domain-containing protein n=1 Tax=Streptomyces fagopyri TaxID=2662397 RepID=UPI0037178B14
MPCGRPNWQRRYAAVRELLAEEAGLTELQTDVTVHGMDVGNWLAKQRKPATWQALVEGQRERLEQLGIAAPTSEPEAPAKPSTVGVSASSGALRPSRGTRHVGARRPSPDTT